MTLLPTIDWAAFGRVLGVSGRHVEAPDGLTPALEEALASDGPFVVDVVTDRDCLTPVGPYNKMAAEYEYGHHN